MKIKLLAAGLALFGLVNIARSQTLVTNVTVAPLWTDTGLYLTNSEWVTVNAAGSWGWGGPGGNDPDGLEDFNGDDLWIFNSIQGGLIAFIGADPYQGSQWESGIYQTNQYVQVGTAGQFVTATNGELWLGINDAAFVGSTNRSSGSVVAAVSLNFSHCDYYTNVSLNVAQVASNFFSFSVSHGIPGTVCSIYDSADLVHWTLVDALVLNGNGSSLNSDDVDPPSPTSGLSYAPVDGAFLDNTGVPYRFYKASNGQFWSQTIGFARITVGPGTTNSLGAPGTNAFIANQFITPDNTLNGLFNPMADGSTLPNGSAIGYWTGSGYNYYTYSGGSWSPNGNATLNPGQAAMLVVSNTTTITFAGLVPQGWLTNVLNGGNAFNPVSSQVPQAGGITSVLDYNPTNNPANRDEESVLLWNGDGWNQFIYLNCSDSPVSPGIPGWYTATGAAPDEPILKVGQGCFIRTGIETNATYWVRKYPGCCGQ